MAGKIRKMCVGKSAKFGETTWHIFGIKVGVIDRENLNDREGQPT